jgi:hypothetical protein
MRPTDKMLLPARSTRNFDTIRLDLEEWPAPLRAGEESIKQVDHVLTPYVHALLYHPVSIWPFPLLV